MILLLRHVISDWPFYIVFQNDIQSLVYYQNTSLISFHVHYLKYFGRQPELNEQGRIT